MAEPEKPPGFGDFDQRLTRLREARRSAEKPDPEGEPRLDWGRGLQVGIELIAGVAGGCLLGWALDRWLGTAPFLFIGGFLLGAAAGMLNAYRHLRRFADDRAGVDDAR